jgi:uncharacterized protein (TIRG00374 family)
VRARHGVRIAVLAVTAATCALLVYHLDYARVRAAFSGVTWGWVLVAVAINIANTGIEAVRWRLIATPVKRGVRVTSTFVAMVAGVAGNLLLPFKLGDGARAYVFARTERISIYAAIGTVVADRLADTSAFTVMALALSLVVPLPGALGVTVRYISVGLAVALALAVTIAAIRPVRGVLAAGTGLRTASMVDRALSALTRFLTGAPILPVALAAAASWFARATVVWVMMQAFHLPVPTVAAVVALVIINVGITVAGVPANIGSFELAAVGALRLYSVASEVAASYAIALHAAELLPVLAIGAILAWFGLIDPERQLDASA